MLFKVDSHKNKKRKRKLKLRFFQEVEQNEVSISTASDVDDGFIFYFCSTCLLVTDHQIVVIINIIYKLYNINYPILYMLSVYVTKS